MGRTLSKTQQEAVNAINGHILVVSCPGSGKTTVIIERLKNMIQMGIDPKTMLNITFTKAAAEEMQKRFQKECNATVNFSTIHSFCYRVLCNEYGYTKEDILKESEKYAYIGNQLIASKKYAPAEIDEVCSQVVSEISYVKNRELNPSIYTPEALDKEIFLALYRGYEEYKEDMRKFDFDDMLIICRDLFKNKPQILDKYKHIYKYITVDEFQDVNGIQAEICYMLTGEDGNLFVVGDDDQSIYKFRAADSSIMLNFPKRFKDCRMINMDTNYRSGKHIVKIAGNLIKHNRKRFSKNFNAFQEYDGNIYIEKCSDSTKQVEDILKTITELHEKENLPYEDMAILYRTNSLAIAFIAQFIKKEIPFYSSEMPKSHHDFIYEDIMAYYRLANGQEKKGDIQRILNRPSRYLKAEYFRKCSSSMEDLLRACNYMGNGSDRAKCSIFELMDDLKQLKLLQEPKKFINYLVNVMGYKDWLIQYAEFRGKLPEDSLMILDTITEEASQFSNMEDWILYVKHYEMKLKEIKKKKEKKGICLSTYHSAKGLEWNTVFTPYVNEGITPFAKAETPEELEEERRMFYVAITRAKQKLVMTYIEGDNGKSIHSPYFEEMGFLLSNVGIGNPQRKLNPDKGMGI